MYARGHRPAIVVAVLYILKIFSIYEKNGSTARPTLFIRTHPSCSICVCACVVVVVVFMWVIVSVVPKKCAFLLREITDTLYN